MKEPVLISPIEPLEAVETLKAVDLVNSIETSERLPERERVHPLPPLPITGFLIEKLNLVSEKRASLLER